MSAPPVEVVIDGGAASITLTREKAHNAMSPDLLEGLHSAVQAVTDAGCRVATVRGRGRALSAGADLPYLLGLGDDRDAVAAYIAQIGAALDAIEAAPFISVCVVDGYGVAGGCELMLACDLVVASTEARIGDRHMEYGMLPGAGGSVRLPRVLPAALARRLLYTGEIVDGATAAAMGLVGWCVEPDDLEPTVGGIVARLLRHSTSALAGMKRMYFDGLAVPYREALAAEQRTVVEHLTGNPDAREGLAAFAGKRAPEFQGV